MSRKPAGGTNTQGGVDEPLNREAVSHQTPHLLVALSPNTPPYESVVTKRPPLYQRGRWE